MTFESDVISSGPVVAKLKSICLICCALCVGLCSYAQSGRKQKSFLVCGDSKVLLVDYTNSRDSIPKIIWKWDAHQAYDLPEDYRERKFNSVDDCKAIKGGRQVLVSSSAGAVALVDRRSGKVLFHANVPNAHSVELLPGNRLAAAASTSPTGNQVIVYRIEDPEIPLHTDSLYSAHGLVWHRKRKSLFALGFDVLREYKLAEHHNLRLVNKWTIPGIGGHDLQLSPDERSLFVTEHEGCWRFDLRSYEFKKIDGFPDAHNIKSLGQDKTGQFIFTIPEQSWWTYHVRFFNPSRKFAFPDMKVYKARWFGK